MSQLRFIERDGKKILQQRQHKIIVEATGNSNSGLEAGYIYNGIWEDVPFESNP